MDWIRQWAKTLWACWNKSAPRWFWIVSIGVKLTPLMTSKLFKMWETHMTSYTRYTALNWLNKAQTILPRKLWGVSSEVAKKNHKVAKAIHGSAITIHSRSTWQQVSWALWSSSTTWSCTSECSTRGRKTSNNCTDKRDKNKQTEKESCRGLKAAFCLKGPLERSCQLGRRWKQANPTDATNYWRRYAAHTSNQLTHN